MLNTFTTYLNKKKKSDFQIKKEHGASKCIPHILIGASSSKSIGCFKKISLETTQSFLISASESCTCFPGLPLTSSNLLMIASRTPLSITMPLRLNWNHEDKLTSKEQQIQQREIKGQRRIKNLGLLSILQEASL